MKNILYIFSVITLMMAASCADVLNTETKSSFDESVVYSNYTLAEYTVFSISEIFGHTNSYRGRYLPWYGFNTDVEWYNSTSGDSNIQLAQYSVLPNNSNMNLSNGPYNEIYTGVERANLCIANLRKYGNPEANADMASLLGEALTLRALLYYDLVKAWGDVPARFDPITGETIYVARTNRDEIFKQILADLEEAFNYLSWPNQSAATQTTDRVSLAFAKGLYARIALTASGYALRPADGAVGTGDVGSVRLSSDPDLQKSVLYPKALQALKDVINSGTCSLYATYEDLWRDMNNFDLTAGKEILFVIPFGSGRGRWNYTFAIRSEGAMSITNTASSRAGAAGPVPTLFFDYEKEDVRRDVSCVNYKWAKTDNTVLAGIDTWYFGKYRFEWMETQPYTGGNDDGIKPVYMRYADILLMASEIANELDDLNTAKTYLSQVRRRAYAGNEAMADAYVNAISSKDAMFNAIVDERALEFVGEFLRKADLIRWNMLTSKMDETKNKMAQLATRSGDYSFLTGDVYYRTASDGKALDIFGLDPSEFGNPGDDWTLESSYISDTKLTEAKIASMYAVNPDTRQFWPIFAITVTDSQGALKNDYGYTE